MDAYVLRSLSIKEEHSIKNWLFMQAKALLALSLTSFFLIKS